jgi:hypothetical protein
MGLIVMSLSAMMFAGKTEIEQGPAWTGRKKNLLGGDQLGLGL